MTTTTVRYEVAVPSVVKAPARYFLKTVGARHTVVDALTGYTVAAYWTLPEAVAALAAKVH